MSSFLLLKWNLFGHLSTLKNPNECCAIRELRKPSVWKEKKNWQRLHNSEDRPDTAATANTLFPRDADSGKRFVRGNPAGLKQRVREEPPQTFRISEPFRILENFRSIFGGLSSFQSLQNVHDFRLAKGTPRALNFGSQKSSQSRQHQRFF